MASIYETERGESTIIINGVKMTLNEYKKKRADEKKALKPKRTRKKTETKELGDIAKEIDGMLKEMSILKSIQVYKNHAYRSWGNIATEILSYRGIRKPMATYCVNFGELNTLLNDVKNFANKNERNVFQYIDKMAWKLDDIRINITEMSRAIHESGVCQRFRTHEAINGKGRQLGLETVINKALRAMTKIDDAIKRLKEIADDGVDIMTYGNHLSLKERRRVL